MGSVCRLYFVPEEGWFGQPKYSTPSKKHYTLCRSFTLAKPYIISEEGGRGWGLRTHCTLSLGPHLYFEFQKNTYELEPVQHLNKIIPAIMQSDKLIPVTPSTKLFAYRIMFCNKARLHSNLPCSFTQYIRKMI